MNGIVQPLVDAGLLRLTLPEKPKSSRQTYVSEISENPFNIRFDTLDNVKLERGIRQN